jgi:hypothetical protein
MVYDEDTDRYTCAAGKQLTFDYDKKSKSESGFTTTTSVYSCKECAGCPWKEKCIRAGGSKVKVEVGWTLLSIAYNVLKLHHKLPKAAWEQAL